MPPQEGICVADKMKETVKTTEKVPYVFKELFYMILFLKNCEVILG